MQRRLITIACVAGGVLAGYFVAGAVAVAVLVAAPVDEDDERFLSLAVLFGLLLMVTGGVMGWRMRQRSRSGQVVLLLLRPGGTRPFTVSERDGPILL